MKIELVMIVRDEAKQLRKCLASVREEVDGILIGDTGSTDGTPEIARRLGARTIEIPWEDDFAAARNAAIGAATGDWILVLDADERLAPEEAGLLRSLVADGDRDVWRFVTRNYVRRGPVPDLRPHDGSFAEAGDAPGWYPSVKERLWRRDRGLRFRGRVHELLDLGSVPEDRIGEAPISVHHLGELADRPGKGERYLELLRLRVGEEPDDPRAHLDLALQLARLGPAREGEARQRIRRALELAPDSARILLEAGRLFIGTVERPEAILHLRRAVDLDPSLAAGWGILAMEAVQRESYEEAEDLARRSLATGRAVADAFRALGFVRRSRGDLPGAIAEFERATLVHPLDPAARSNLGIAFAEAEDLDRAVRALAEAYELSPESEGILGSLVLVTHRRGDVEGAVALCRDRIVREPAAIPPRLWLVEILLADGRPDEAADLLDDLERIGIDDPRQREIVAELRKRIDASLTE